MIFRTLAAIVAGGCFLIGPLSRRPSGLGVSQGRLAACPDSPNCVCSQDPVTAPGYIPPLEFKGDPKTAFAKLGEVLRSTPRVTVIESRDDYLYAEFRTPALRFVDDVEFLLDPAAKQIQVRSASRVGRSDLGVNRRRVESLRARLAALAP